MRNRIFSIILTLTMILSLLPASALAVEPSFGISMGGTQLEAGKYYRTDADGNTEETTAENYEIYFIADDTNVYTLTINGAAEHEITFGSATSLTVIDYGQSPTGNRVTYTPRESDTVMVQTMDNNVADGTFVVLTAGKLNAALAPDQFFALAYQEEDGSFTNARHFHASADNNDEGEQYFTYFLLFGYPGIDDSLSVSGGDSVTIDDVLYTYHDVPTRAMTIHFSMDRSPYITADHFGELTVRADSACSDVLNGYDFVAGYPTEAVFNVEQPKPCLINGTIALDNEETVIVNGVTVTGENVIVSMVDGIATVEGSAVISDTLEISGNPGDEEYISLVEITENSSLTLHTGHVKALQDTTLPLKDSGTLEMQANASIHYNNSHLELKEGTITANALTKPVINSDANLTLNATGSSTSFTLDASYQGITLSGLSGNVQVTMEEGSELIYDIGDDTQVIRAQSHVGSLTIGSDGSISGEIDKITITNGSADPGDDNQGSGDDNQGSGDDNQGSGDEEPTPTVIIRYKVTTDAENGTINIGERYQRNDTVTFTVIPDAGYVFKNLTITRKSGAEVTYTEKDGIYSFKMPASAVTVKAEFVLTFEDIEPDHQFYEAIEWVYQNKLMNGVSETTFDRINPITRQQVWRVLARILNNEDPGSMAAAKKWAVTQGITDGINPGAAATREEFVTMLWTAFGKPAADAVGLTAFSDASTISADATAAMAWAVSKGLVDGYEDGTLRPAATASRGAFAAILFRCLAK